MLRFQRMRKHQDLIQRIRHQAFLRITEGARHFDRLADELKTQFPNASDTHIWVAIALEVEEWTGIYLKNDSPLESLVLKGLATDDQWGQEYYANRARRFCRYHRASIKAALSAMLLMQIESETEDERWHGAIKALSLVEFADQEYAVTFREELDSDIRVEDCMPLSAEVWLSAIKEAMRQRWRDPTIEDMCRAHWKIRVMNCSSEIHGRRDDLEDWRSFLIDQGIDPEG